MPRRSARRPDFFLGNFDYEDEEDAARTTAARSRTSARYLVPLRSADRRPHLLLRPERHAPPLLLFFSCVFINYLFRFIYSSNNAAAAAPSAARRAAP